MRGLATLRDRPWLLAWPTLLAYTWNAPFRDLYGLEARNALMAREMLEGGLGLIPTALGHPYPDYPPLYFWLAALFSSPVGHVTTLSASLPSALAASGLVALTARLGCEIRPRVGWLAALILATSPEFWLKGSRVTIDMLLAFEVTVALSCLFFLEQTAKGSARRRSLAVGAAAAMGCAFLTKGPVGLALPAAIWGTYLSVLGRYRACARFLLATGALGVICMGAEAAAAWHAGGAGLVREMAEARVGSRFGQESNRSPLYYFIYLLRAGGPWWAWGLAALVPLARTIRARKASHPFRTLLPVHPMSRLALVWVLTVFCLFSLASSRHGRYLLPLFPALSILLALAVDQALERGWPGRSRPWERALAGLVGLLALAGPGLALAFPATRVAPLPLVVVWLLAIGAGWGLAVRLTSHRMRLVSLLALVLTAGLTGEGVLLEPALSARESGRAFVEAAEAQVTTDIPVVLYGLHPDRNGVKYALYSGRAPAHLQFVSGTTGLKDLPRPCLLISYEDDSGDCLKRLTGTTARLLAQGVIHRRPVVAYLLEETDT